VRDGFYPDYRFPIEVIRHAVWLYHRFCLSLREISELLFERGIFVSHETIRDWCRDFGPDFAAEVKKRRPQPGTTRHLDEVFLKIKGQQKYLWRAVDENGIELDVFITDRRDKKAPKQFFKRLLACLQYKPKVIVTDKLRSYGAALREVLPKVSHVAHKYANCRAENSHRHVRKRERHLQKFKSATLSHSKYLCYLLMVWQHSVLGQGEALLKLQFLQVDNAPQTIAKPCNLRKSKTSAAVSVALPICIL
jgi:putative transposase